MTSRQPYWCSKTKKRRPYWCTKPLLRELNSIFMQNSSFVFVKQSSRWSRESKRAIALSETSIKYKFPSYIINGEGLVLVAD